jgi:hypothetical protein
MDDRADEVLDDGTGGLIWTQVRPAGLSGSSRDPSPAATESPVAEKVAAQ